MKLRALFAVLAVLAAAACGNTNQISGYACPALATPSPKLISPANGATGVPVTIGTVTLAFGVGAPSPTVTLTSPGNATITAGPPASLAGGSTTASNPQLSAATTYTVFFNTGGTPQPCYRPSSTAIGSFST